MAKCMSVVTVIRFLESGIDQVWDRVSPEIQGEIYQLVAEGHWRILLDMRRVTYISSSGLGLIIKTHTRLRDLGGRLVLCGLQPFVREKILLNALEKLLMLADGIEDGLEKFQCE